MKRKEEKHDDNPDRFANENERYMLIKSRRPEHDQAFDRLKKKFGRKHFDQSDAVRVGVGVRMVKELVVLGSLLFTKNRYRLNRASEAVNEYETPVHHFRQNFTPSRPEPRVLAAARHDSTFREKCEPVSTTSDDWLPSNVFTHVRMPKTLDDILKSSFQNKSAYIRYLIYTDLGMTKEAEREKRRMEPRI